jgi:hypothetical protein
MKMRGWLNEDILTLKAFANFNPGLCFWQPWVHRCLLIKGRNPDGVATKVGLLRKRSQVLQSCDESHWAFLTQGFKANPGLKLANAFSVMFLAPGSR